MQLQFREMLQGSWPQVAGGAVLAAGLEAGACSPPWIRSWGLNCETQRFSVYKTAAAYQLALGSSLLIYIIKL